MSNNKKQLKHMGLSGVWSESTRSITSSFATIGNIASAAQASSAKLEAEAWWSNADAAVERMADLGITGEEGKPLDALAAVAASKELLQQLRGY